MKTEKNILIAFILNLVFSIFEFVGGAITGSVAIVSDAVHDVGDAISIGMAYFLERKSKKKADEVYTYGYARYSVIGGFVTTTILIFGSAVVIYNSVRRMITPVDINYDGMIIFAVIGVAVNFLAAWFTKEGDSLNQRAVNLHMLEDVLGWAIVLVGAIVMRFTDISIIDPVMSICVSAFIFINALKNLKEIENIFLEKVPSDIKLQEIKEHICKIDGVSDAHHIHIWSLDGQTGCATMHVVTDEDGHKIKEKIREELKEHNIAHATLELESTEEYCHLRDCYIKFGENYHHHHHH